MDEITEIFGPNSFMQAFDGESSGPMTADQINAELSQAVAQSNNLPTLAMLWSFGFEAEDLLALYAALRTYLRALVNQDQEDLAMIGRIAKLLSEMNPSVVKASKALALKAVGMERRIEGGS